MLCTVEFCLNSAFVLGLKMPGSNKSYYKGKKATYKNIKYHNANVEVRNLKGVGYKQVYSQLI